MSKNVLLGVCGSISAYRAADLARDLMRAGCEVRVCLTDAAEKFVTPLLFETLTGQPALRSVFEEPVQGRMAHIDWARWADLILIAPATANTIAKLAGGVADDMLTSLALASTAPLVMAPAMNPQMYTADATVSALKVLEQRAAVIVQPVEGDVACGEHGQGKLASNAAIAASVLSVLSVRQTLAGKRVLITSGPTQEPIDSVRYLSNRSSGKMGVALARAALLMGAEVRLVTGPTSVSEPLVAKIVRVRTALEMLAAAREEAARMDLIVGAAAVADYRPAHIFEGKLRRGSEEMCLDLVANPDIIATLAYENRETAVVGFAAEPSEGLKTVREKLARKQLFAIAANNISDSSIGFESDENELTLLFASGEETQSGRRTKLACALWLFEQVAARSAKPVS